MQVLAPAQLDDVLAWRYATKAFDPDRIIADEVWAALERSLVLTPSSYGLQPWRFVVVRDRALRERLRAVSWNQSQVTECSHHVVFCARSEMREADVQRLIDATAAARGVTAEKLAGYKAVIMRDIVNGPRAPQAFEWATRQCYIALGQFMLASAALGIDACPMEGIEPAKYDEILGLTGSGYRSVVACAAGYRAANDAYAKRTKVRYPLAQVVDHR